MSDYRSLSHSRWECKYHVVFIPKYRKKRIFGVLRTQLGGVFRKLAEQKESQIEEGHVMPDHVHATVWFPEVGRLSRFMPKYYPFNLYTEKKALEKLDYMHKNPVTAGLVEQACDWQWSSARYYEQRKSVGVPLGWVF